MKITFDNFSKSYGETVVFDNFCYVFESGAITAIMGASGSGKTTLLNAVAGLIDYEGSITPDIRKVSYVFQEPRLIPQKTVFANLDFALSSALPDKAIRKQKIEAMLKEVGLEDAMHKYPHELSGGMAQRVALVRAFLYPAEILLMDEPFKGLDKDLKNIVTATFLNLWQKDKRTTLLVTHDESEAKQIANYRLVISG
ncbi:MAG: ATP-binding cassette domain-containing protein [Firmicutes bacterium]|nr:ATP-binding cassette domain-containing protein [Bacillota bacterium]